MNSSCLFTNQTWRNKSQEEDDISALFSCRDLSVDLENEARDSGETHFPIACKLRHPLDKESSLLVARNVRR